MSYKLFNICFLVCDRYFELCGYVGCNHKYNRDRLFRTVARLFSGVLDGNSVSLLCNHRVLDPLCNRGTSLLDPKGSPFTLWRFQIIRVERTAEQKIKSKTNLHLLNNPFRKLLNYVDSLTSSGCMTEEF